MSSPVKLPRPWQAVYDDDSGLYYYWNEETDEVTWQHPSEKAKLDDEKLPEGWKKERDPETGEVFYWNIITDETQWDPPSEPAVSTSKSTPAIAAAKPVEPEPASVPPGRTSITSIGKRKPRQVVMGESYSKTGEKFVLTTYPKSDASKTVIKDALLAAGFLFSSLAPEDLDQVVMAMSEKQLPKGHTIIRQGDAGDNFYVVESGDFDIFVNGNRVASRGPGTSFGELALLYNSPRAATVTSTKPCVLWALDRHTFRHMLASSREFHLDTVISALRNVPLLRSLTAEQMDKIADAVQVMSFKPGDTIIRKGDTGDAFYIIKSGKVVCTGAGTATKVMADEFLTEGSYFGERALLMSAPRAANVIAVDQTQCMVLGRQAFTELLGPLRELLDRNLGLRVLHSVPALKALSPSDAEQVLGLFQSVSFAGGQTLLTAGQRYSTLFVVKSGAVRITKGRDSEDMIAGGYFGEQALGGDAVSDCAVTAVDSVECFVLDRRRIEREFASLLPKLVVDGAGVSSGKVLSSPSAIASPAPAPAPSVAKPRLESDIKFGDLQHVAVLGSGTFGRVSLVRHVPTNRAFAFKAMQKAQIVAYKQQNNVLNEKNVLMMLDHPFILKLEKTFKDANTLYMLLELVQGGELFSLLANHEDGRLPSRHARFYAGCVTSALEHMHSMDILYRDLKPENMLIDAEGYIKMVDMGFAKVVKTGRTYTLCGTPEYLAPEIVMGQGHHKGVDYWALGVLIFEMLCGYSPFADLERNDQMTICKNIVKANLVFPEYVTDPGAKDLIRLLLTKNVAQRLGCGKNGAKDICNHSWFLDFDWTLLIKKKIKPFWTPTLSGPLDASHFPPTEDDHDPMPYSDDGSLWDAEF